MEVRQTVSSPIFGTGALLPLGSLQIPLPFPLHCVRFCALGVVFPMPCVLRLGCLASQVLYRCGRYPRIDWIEQRMSILQISFLKDECFVF